MTREPLAVRLCRAWARTYTRGLPAEIGERRVREIESDLWEHLRDGDTAEREILGRTVRGIHADVWWRYRTLLDSRGVRQRSHVMTTTTRNWWTPVTAVIGVIVTAMGLVGLVAGEAMSGSNAAVVLAAGAPAIGGLLILGGLATRRQRTLTGSRLVVAGAVLVALDPLFIPLSAVVIIGGLWSGNLALTDEQADSIRLAATRRSLSQGWYRWLVAAILLTGIGFGVAGIAEAAIDTDQCTETNPCWQGTAAWATFTISLLGAMVTGGIGVVLGILRILTRHHTRPA